jgi:hypothetical protein
MYPQMLERLLLRLLLLFDIVVVSGRRENCTVLLALALRPRLPITSSQHDHEPEGLQAASRH